MRCLFTDGAVGASSEKNLTSQEILGYPDWHEEGCLSKDECF